MLSMSCHYLGNLLICFRTSADAKIGPTAFSNGPTCVEVQGDWIVQAISKMRAENVKTLDTTREAEEEWHQKCNDLANDSLFVKTKSWYMGANVPGKKIEALNYQGGFPAYKEATQAALDGWKGFVVVNA